MKIGFFIIFFSLTIYSCQTEVKICGISSSVHDSIYNNRFICKYILLNRNSICFEENCALITEIWLEEQWSCKGQDPPLNEEIKQLIIRSENEIPLKFGMEHTIITPKGYTLGHTTKFLLTSNTLGSPDTIIYYIYEGNMTKHKLDILDSLIFVKQEDEF